MNRNSLSIYCSSAFRAASSMGNSSNPKFVNKAESGRSNFERDFEKSHIKTNLFQKILLGVGSGMMSIASPSRGDMIAVMGEVTGYQALEYIRNKMNESSEGREILEEKPRISSRSIDLEKLKSYPENTLGRAYSNFLEKYGYSPDTRNAVQFVDDVELAYVAQRYRETHDLVHTLLDMPTNMLGEVSVKWVEAIQLKLPMCATGALFGAARLAPKFSRTYASHPIVKLSPHLVEKLKTNAISPRTHPGVMHIPRVTLPAEVEATMKGILGVTDRKNLFAEAGVLARHIAHRSLPTEREERKRLYKQYYMMYKAEIADFDAEDEKMEMKLRKRVIEKIRTITYKWAPIKFDKRMSLRYLIGRTPAEYAVLKKVLGEIRKRDEGFAPKSLLDFGSGIGTVSWAAYELWGDTLQEYYCVDASNEMNELAAMILRRNDVEGEPFIKNVYFRQFFPATPRPFDVVVSAFTFFELRDCQQRMRMLTALWNDTTEYLVLIENGTTEGFRIITEAREFLVSISKQQDIDCHIFAPCPHEYTCPRFDTIGKKKPCTFEVLYKKFSFSKADDSQRQRFCYLIFRKKPKPPEIERTARITWEVKKHRRLAVCKICTNEGKQLDLHVTAAKHGKAAYQCMKVSRWGDLLPGPLEPRQIADGSKPLIGSDSGASGELISDSDSSSDSSSDSDSDSDSDPTVASQPDDNVENVKKQRKKYVSTYLPWAVRTGHHSGFLMSVYFEKRWEQPVSDLYRELKIKPVPDEKRFFSEVSV